MNFINNDEDQIESAQKFWLALFSSAWILFLVYLIVIQHHYCFGALLLPFSGFVIKRLKAPSELMARALVPIVRHASSVALTSAQKAAARRFTAAETERRKQEQATNATREIVKRLGVIEGYIRVLEGETDPKRRTVTFQAAHQEITEISAKRASGEIPPEVLRSSDIVDQAKSTNAHLAKLGLASDPLSLEITRVFKLTV
jgi:hypothetical protein